MDIEKKTIHFLSASDRINYGDLLFPIIFKRVLSKYNLDFLNYGIVKSDLKYFGALPTKSYKQFQKNIKKSGGNIVIGGGEVFFGNWTTLYAFINPLFARLAANRFFKKIEKKNHLSKRFLSNGSVLVPFAPSTKELKNANANVFYNSVGGRFYGEIDDTRNKEIITGLKTSKYISVRDFRTQNSLKDFGVDSNLSPDSALIMSDFFPVEKLEHLIKIKKNDLPKKYIFVQIGRNKSTNNLEEFAQALENQLKLLNAEAILCPIGMAPNHEDQIVLKELNELSDRFNLLIPNNIYDIMYLIAKSIAYLGTSLHGTITAQSFNVPFIPLNKKVKKADFYCKTWSKDVCSKCIDFDEVSTVSDIISNWNSELMNELTIKQKEMVYSNFDTFIKQF